MLFSDMGGIDIEEVAESHPDHVGRGHFSNILPLSDYQAKEVVASVGVTGARLNRLVPILTALARLFVQRDMTLAEINPLGELEDGSFVALDAHMDMENEARPRQAVLLDELGVSEEETRQAREATPFELAGEAVDAMDHRGVAGNVTEFDGDLGLVIGAGGGSLTLFDAVRAHGGKPANYCEIGGNPQRAQGVRAGQARAREARRGQDRGDDVDRLQHAGRHRRARRDQGVPGARLRPGGEDLDLPHPGRLGGGGVQDPRALRGRATPTARPPCTTPRGWPSRERRRHEHPHRRDHHLHRPGHHRARGGQPHARVPGLRQGRAGGRRRHARAQGPRRARRARLRHRRPGRGSSRPTDRRLGRHRPPRLHQGRRLRGDRERRQARRHRHRAHPAPRRGRDGRARRPARRAHHRPQLPGDHRPRRDQDGRHRRARQGRAPSPTRAARSGSSRARAG